MTNLKICVPDIPFQSSRIIASNSTADIENQYNLIGGERFTFCKLAAAASSCTYTFDLGDTYTNKNASVEYLLISRADLLGCNTVTLERSPDNSAWTNVFNITTFTGTSRVGPRSNDYITTTTLTSAFRYWRLGFSMSAGTNTFSVSKINFGSFFNFSFDCDFKVNIVPPELPTLEYPSGAVRKIRDQEPRYRIELKWGNETDTVLKNFSNKVVRYHDICPVWLYTSAESQVLDGKTLIHCKLVEFETRRDFNNLNSVRAVFEEVIG